MTRRRMETSIGTTPMEQFMVKPQLTRRPRIVSIDIPGRPHLINAERSQHWRQHGLATKGYRTEAALRLGVEGRKGQMGKAKVDVWSHYKRKPIPDVAACLPSVKAIIDGAVDAGLLEDDDPDHVVYLGFHRPVVDKELGDLLLVTFEEVEEDSPWAM